MCQVSLLVPLDLKCVCQRLLFHRPSVYHSSCDEHLALAQLELVRLRRWEEIAQLACGLWLSASPFIFDYAHQDHLRFWHWALGAIVSILALFELWQDWNRADVAALGR